MRTFVVAKVLVVNDKNEVLALRRSQSDERRPGQWDVPGGWVEDGEDAIATAVRETAEETGLHLEQLKLVFAFSDPTDPHGSGTWLAFLARVEGQPEVSVSYEHDASAWLPLEQAISEFTYERQRHMLAYVRDNRLLET